MIPEAESALSCIDLTRWRLTQLAAALVRSGVPVDLVMRDAREGCDLALKNLLREVK